ncbi:hypothetical protein F4821DRAFT_208716 [Hypoxylon rubiginosum]|uniref:Uncharacterized protein n=1 Tax=Hypoxylon rubiginosum TaxID=110542 RepID=A0ACC0CQ19_9PEZI|nr:hypothetical protein F4821DRAFT_208716 [Hypoxylon rubiginosum]
MSGSQHIFRVLADNESKLFPRRLRLAIMIVWPAYLFTGLLSMAALSTGWLLSGLFLLLLAVGFAVAMTGILFYLHNYNWLQLQRFRVASIRHYPMVEQGQHWIIGYLESLL